MWGWISIVHCSGECEFTHEEELPMVMAKHSISVVGANHKWPVLYRCLSATSCRFFLCKTDCATPFSAAGAVFYQEA